MKENIIDKYIRFSKENIENYTKIILNKLFIKEIFSVLLDCYISANYYNYYDNLSGFDEIGVKQYLKLKKDEVFDDTLFYQDEIDNNYQAFLYAIDLDELKEFNEDNSIFSKLKNFKSKFEDKEELPNNFGFMIRNNIMKRNNFLKQFETDDFYIDYKKTNINHLYDTHLEHNIKFSELYSDVAIKKAFNKDLIVEQKMFVTYHLLSVEILQNVINKKIQKLYLVDFDYTLFEKEKKLKRLLKIIDNDLLKEKMIFKLEYKVFLEREEYILKMIQDGYDFALEIDDAFEDNDINIIKLSSFEFFIITDDKYYFSSLKQRSNIVDFRR